MPFAQGEEAAPPDPCCNNLANVIREQPDCVCPILNRSISLPVNRSLVLELPSLCRINVSADADTISLATIIRLTTGKWIRSPKFKFIYCSVSSNGIAAAIIEDEQLPAGAKLGRNTES
uniref:Bifunctional inhibitor/plant lipid transfer protein/seed storage helical domain-containing protein n=1 Tax=Ananas comosus var. bracteatus TaxID=296719 RepID=A0A6V7P333_ANACO|nr:unnamed protein product [Ananas comosus var. bracteatus]